VLRSKAARFFESAASSETAREAERLNEVGCQLELWADELDEVARASERKASKPRNEAEAEQSQPSLKRRGADTRF
jgi:hypothetical protein